MEADANDVDHGRRRVSTSDTIRDLLTNDNDKNSNIEQHLLQSKNRKKRIKSSSKRRTKQRLQLRHEGLPQIEETDEEESGDDDQDADSEMTDTGTADSTETTEYSDTQSVSDRTKNHPKQRPFERVTVKFEFAIKDNKARKSTRELHKEVITLMQSRFEDNILKVHTNKSKTIDMTTCTGETHSQEFQVHIMKDRKYGTKHVIVHQLTMNKPLSTIKRDKQICPYLDKHRIYLKIHAFGEEDWDTVPIGWKLYTHPFRENLQTVKDDISSFLQAEEKIAHQKAQASFAISVGTPTAIHNDTKYDTKAFIIETRRTEREKLHNYMQKLYAKNSAYVPLTTKYKDPEGAAAAIQIQNQYIKDFRTITIQGVTESMMFYMENRIKATAGVFSIEKTSETDSLGKWYIVTNIANFRSTLRSLHEARSDMAKDIPPGQDGHKLEGFPTDIEIQTLSTRNRKEPNQLPNTNATDSSAEDISEHSSETWKAMAPLLSNQGDNKSTPDIIFVPTKKKSGRMTWSDIASIDSGSEDSALRENNTIPRTATKAHTAINESSTGNSKSDQQTSTLTDPQSVQVLQATVQKMEAKMTSMTDTINKLTAYIHDHLQLTHTPNKESAASISGTAPNSSPATEDKYMTRTEAQEILQGIISRELSREMEKYFSPMRHSQPTSISLDELRPSKFRTPTKSPPTKKRDRSTTPTFPRPPLREPPDRGSQAEEGSDDNSIQTISKELEEALANINMPNVQQPPTDSMETTEDEATQIPQRLEFAQAPSQNE